MSCTFVYAHGDWKGNFFRRGEILTLRRGTLVLRLATVENLAIAS
jgi:hypothetical protein